MSQKKIGLAAALVALASLSACGGGGGSSGGSTPPPAPPVPTATLSAAAADAKVGSTTTLTWSSTNATSCVAGGDWTGTLAASGSQSVTVSKTSSYSLSCTGAGGNATASASVTAWAAPTATITSSDAAVLANNSVTLTWSSTNATACSITGLTGVSATSGSQATDKLATTTTFPVTCRNPAYTGADAATASSTVNVSTTYSLVVTAKYEQPGLATVVGVNGYLLAAFDKPVVNAVPYVWIEIQKADGTVVTGSYADANGQVRFTNLDPAVKYTPAMRSKSMQNGFDLWVVKNTAPVNTSASNVRDRYAPYADKGVEYAADVKKVSQSTDLLATIGWDATTKSLDNTKRVSAPYSIIAMTNVVENMGRVAAGGSAAPVSPTYTVLWTPTNKGGSTSFTPDYDGGLMNGSGGYSARAYAGIDASGKGTGATISEHIMFLSGDPAFEVMEFGGVVAAHETWHFIQQTRFRNTSLGGEHTFTGYFDPRVVWSEGMANSIPLLVANSPKLARLLPVGGEIIAATRDYSVGSANTPVGWFQELTVPRLVWSIYDPAGSFKLSVSQILAPMFSAQWEAGVWPTNLWAYGKLLKAANAAFSSAIDSLAASLSLVFAGSDEWGAGETNLGNRSAADSLPVATTISPGTTTTVCSAGAPNEYNKLGNRRWLKIIGDGRSHTYSVSGPANTVPMITLLGTNADITAGRVKGVRSFAYPATVTHPSGLAWAELSECTVANSQDAAQNTSCSAASYTPPTEQCWTITVSP